MLLSAILTELPWPTDIDKAPIFRKDKKNGEFQEMVLQGNAFDLMIKE